MLHYTEYRHLCSYYLCIQNYTYIIYYRILMDIYYRYTSMHAQIINMYILYHPVSFLSNSIHLLSERLLLRFFWVNLFCHKFPLISHLLKPLNRSLGTASFHAPNVSWRRQKSSSPSVPCVMNLQVVKAGRAARQPALAFFSRWPKASRTKSPVNIFKVQ